MKEAANALSWAVGEMERRYKIMSVLGVRNLEKLNQKVASSIKDKTPIANPIYNEEIHNENESQQYLDCLPHIVIVVDEFADMMMFAGKRIEQLINRLANKARAAGIHLVLATQRPSVDVITGLIKANIPARIAFQVSSKIDSRTILDQMGAEQLLGHGDMLFIPPGTTLSERIHGAYVADHEVHNVVSYLKEQGEADYLDDVLVEQDETSAEGVSADGSGENTDMDPLYEEAVMIVTETRKASIKITPPKAIRPIQVQTNPFPKFPTDLQAQIMVLMIKAKGVSKIKENIFENRFMHVPELNRMGGKIKVVGNLSIINGPKELNGAEVMATDLRASVSLVLAGLIAKNRTAINRVYHLDRGYENLEKKLRKCRANISRLNH